MSYIQTVRGGRDAASTLVAIASYEGIAAPTVLSLFNSAQLGLDLQIFSGNCHVDDGRNLLVRDFLAGEWDQLVFIDADVSWLQSDLERLIEHDADIVGGVYPKKMQDGSTEFPVIPLPGERWTDERGLIEVDGVPTGFLKIRRCVLETVAETAAHYRDEKDHEKPQIPVIFERTLNGRVRVGGDITFCRKARAAGFRVMVDPMMNLAHSGTKMWAGCLSHFWRKDFAIPEGLEKIRAHTEGPETFWELYSVWDNVWTLSPECLAAVTALARDAKGPILEVGSGLSTLCMANATNQSVVALENVPMWASRIAGLAPDNLDLRLSPLKQYDGFKWYSDVPTEHFDLVVIDGPPDSTSRKGIFSLLNGEIGNATIVFDDLDRGHWRSEVEDYCARMGRNLEIVNASRPFGVAR